MLVEYDTELRTTRFYFSDLAGLERCAEAIEVSRDVAVDIDLDGEPIDVEVQLAPGRIDAEVLASLSAHFPQLIEPVLLALRAMLAGA